MEKEDTTVWPIAYSKCTLYRHVLFNTSIKSVVYVYRSESKTKGYAAACSGHVVEKISKEVCSLNADVRYYLTE